MHHADTRFKRIKRRFKVHLFSPYSDGSAVSARFGDNRHTEKNTHQGCFARTVLPHKPDYLTGVDVKTHPLQNGRSWKFLRNMIDG